MSIEHTLVREILCWLQDRHGSWQRNPRGPALMLHERVHERYTPFPEKQLDDLLSHKLAFDSENENRYLFLEPIDKGTVIVPMLSFRYDFQRNKAELRLQVAIFVPNGNSLAAIGCRFEPSEGAGAHDYFHAQMFRQFKGGRGGPCLPACPSWLPISRPAFQLKANDPVTLLISMLISLYGIDLAQDLRHAPFANELKPYMERLCPTVVRKGRPAKTEPPSQRAKRTRK